MNKIRHALVICFLLLMASPLPRAVNAADEGALGGSIVYQLGVGMYNASAVATGPGGVYTRAADSEGRFVITGMVPGYYTVSAQCDLCMSCPEVSVYVPPGGAVNVRIVCTLYCMGGTAVITGIVADAATGEGVRDAIVEAVTGRGVWSARIAADGDTGSVSEDTGRQGIHTYSMEGGRFMITVTTPARYVLKASGGGYYPSYGEITPISGEGINFDFQLEPVDYTPLAQCALGLSGAIVSLGHDY